MKFPAFLSAFCIFLLPLTRSEDANPPASSGNDHIATWRWVSVDGRRAPPDPFYVRYYPDGKAATWPAPKGWSDSMGVSRGRYSIANGYLILKSDSGTNGPKSRIVIQKDQMILATDEGHRLIYTRVLPSIEPGKLDDGSLAGFSKHPM